MIKYTSIFCKIIVFLGCFIFLESQEVVSYKCVSQNKLNIKINIIKPSKSVLYNGKNIYIYRYIIVNLKDTLASFSTYKFDNKLLIADKKLISPDPTNNQVIFELPKKKYVPIKLSGILSDFNLRFDRYLSINNSDFYYYSVYTTLKNKVKLTSIIFDHNLDMTELKFEHVDIKSCQCTKSGIVVKLL